MTKKDFSFLQQLLEKKPEMAEILEELRCQLNSAPGFIIMNNGPLTKEDFIKQVEKIGKAFYEQWLVAGKLK